MAVVAQENHLITFNLTEVVHMERIKYGPGVDLAQSESYGFDLGANLDLPWGLSLGTGGVEYW